MKTGNAGKPAVQEVAGAPEDAGRVLRGSRPALSAPARDFLKRQRMLFVASIDGDDLWASVLYGPSGFVTTPDARTVLARAAGPRIAGGPVGLLAIEPAACRRISVNGTGELTHEGLRVTIDHVRENCPKHIRRRAAAGPAKGARAGEATEYTTLSGADQALISGADAFVLATAAYGGVDASYRCGSPGFVTVGRGRLTFADDGGTSMYMSLGNVVANPRIGLLFLDWETGDTLQLTGSAQLDLDSRVVHVGVERAVRTRDALPYPWLLLRR